MTEITCNQTNDFFYHNNGMVSLTEIWRKNGRKNKTRPKYFLENESVQILISKVEQQITGQAILCFKGGKNAGTYAHPDIAKIYFKWIDSEALLKYSKGIKEKAALSTIEQLKNIKLIRQYKVGNYRIDGYHKKTNTAYEIDEPHHYINGKLNLSCQKRQKFIEDKLGCQFVRIKV